MPGYNHPPECLCGWCAKTSGLTLSNKPWHIRPIFGTFESYVNPNAICPVCGASVFFYQSKYGGRVFFDELGPPWPKHPCTSQYFDPILAAPADRKTPIPTPSWLSQGWKPLRIDKVYQEGKWWVISAHFVECGSPLRLLVHGKPAIREGVLAALRDWDCDGLGLVSYLSDDGEESGSNIAYKYSEYVFRDPNELIIQLRGMVSTRTVKGSEAQ